MPDTNSYKVVTQGSTLMQDTPDQQSLDTHEKLSNNQKVPDRRKGNLWAILIALVYSFIVAYIVLG